MSPEFQLKAYADLANARLEELLPPAASRPSELHQAMRYSCLAPGKRLRPAMCMASAVAVGHNAEFVIDAACALEMIHCFSLIHDDLPAIDDDDLRRGIPTCHKRFGEAIAILAGDALFALAFETLAKSPHEPLNVVRALQILTAASGSDGLVGGEVVDVLSEGEPIEEERLRFIHSRKTGSLMSASCQVGAVLSNAPEDATTALALYGELVGLAFQIADDILNETADPVLLGKAVGSDRERKKATYTALYGLEGSRSLAEQTVARAKDCVRGLPQSGFLIHLADYTIDRLH